ncbi:methyl-accepting chemotaxis protein [Candidatus Scalindua japonica]|uniref:Methyl-accepting chemotaxis protein n=1 Tax=Candidatus Scalindua japonica TaxID=1284222 RepID=A0A286TXA6_9BACT|nr:cache domain-containing protein [Candidatus Scalindua japonica]GAX60494.1 methyl-accepting chemotaxis protein [Candidatus Scalindua japonica]
MSIKKIFLTIGIAFSIFLITLPLISYKYLKTAVKSAAFNHLLTVRGLLKHEIENYFQERFGDINVLSRNPVIGQAFSRLSKAFHASGLEGEQYVKISELYHPLMEYYLTDYGYVNLYFVDTDGDVMYSIIREEFTGTNLLTGRYKQFSIGQIYANGLDGVAFEDYTWHEALEEFTSYFAAPVYDGQMLLGVLIIEIPFSHLDAIMTRREGLGETGEMYLVGDDSYMRSNSRFSEEPTVLQKEVDTIATREALDGIEGKRIIEDYRRIRVLSVYTPLDLKFVNWALLVEIDEEEAFAAVNTVEKRVTILGSLIASITFLYIYLVTRRKKIDMIAESLEEEANA